MKRSSPPLGGSGSRTRHHLQGGQQTHRRWLTFLPLLLVAVLLQSPRHYVQAQIVSNAAYSCPNCKADSGEGTTAKPFTFQKECYRPEGPCVLDNYSGNLQCTANDVTIASLNGPAGSTCVEGQDTTLTFTATIRLTAQDRYDLGYFLSKDGTLPSRTAGSSPCFDFQLPNACVGTATGPNCALFDQEDDRNKDCCGDWTKEDNAPDLIVTLAPITLPCRKGAGGNLPVDYCSVWQQGGTDSCGGFITTPVTTADDLALLQPGTPAKCTCGTVLTNVLVTNLVFTKTASVPKVTKAGQTVTYSYTVSNTGNVGLKNFVITDNNHTPDLTTDDVSTTLTQIKFVTASDVNGNNVLDPSETWTWTYVYTVTQADIDAGGNMVNIAKVTSVVDTVLGGPGPTATATASVQVDPLKSISVTKTANVASVSSAPTTITYTYKIKNTGDATLTGVVLEDNNFTPATGDDFKITNPTESGATVATPTAGKLDVGETWTYTWQYTVTQALLDSGATSLVNVATADTDQTSPVTDDETVALTATKVLGITKTANPTYLDAPGRVTYTIKVTNEGTMAVAGVVVKDNKFTSATGDDVTLTLKTGCAVGTLGCDTDSDGKLDVGEVWEYTFTYDVTQDDFDAGGSKVNTAYANAPGVAQVSSTATVTLEQKKEMTLQKVPSVNSVTTKGTEITYTYTVKNTGTVTLTDVKLVDDHHTPSISGDDVSSLNQVDGIIGPTGDTTTPGVLSPEEVWTYKWKYTVTQQDIDTLTAAGQTLTNIVTGTSNEAPTSTATASVGVDSQPSMTVYKYSSDSTVQDAGKGVLYTYHVVNTGPVSLTGITIEDDNYSPLRDNFSPVYKSGDINPADGKLSPEERWIYQYTVTITQEQIDAGGTLTNTVTADSEQTGAVTDTHDLLVDQKPKVEITKTSDVATVTKAGDIIEYTYTVTNSGKTTLENIVVVDDNHTPGNPDDDVVLTDEYLPTGDDGVKGVLERGETWTFTHKYTVTQDDVDATPTPLVNVVKVTTNFPAKDFPDATDTATATVQVAGTAILQLEKTADKIYVDGDTHQVITYTYTVKNSGTRTMTDVVVNDDHFTNDGVKKATTEGTYTNTGITYSSGDSDTSGVKGKLDPGETWIYKMTYTVTQDDMDNGGNYPTSDPPQLINWAYATSKAGSTVVDSPLDDASVVVKQSPSLKVYKQYSVSSVDREGDVIKYEINVVNTGNVALSDVKAVDDYHTPGTGDAALDDKTFTASSLTPGVDTDEGKAGKLDRGETWTFEYEYKVTQADIDNGGTLKNTVKATATGADPDVASTEVAVVQSPALRVTKTADVNSVDAVGDPIQYTYVVENTGTVTLENVELKDDYFTSDTDDDKTIFTGATLAPGATKQGTYTYYVTQADMDADITLVNVATATGEYNDGQDSTQASDNEDVTVVSYPSIDVKKVAQDELGAELDPKEVTAKDDKIYFKITVKNDGTQTLTNVVVTDLGLGIRPSEVLVLKSGDSINAGKLDVGETWVYQYVYTVTQADIDAGTALVNIVNVVAQDPSNAGITGTATESVDVNGSKEVELTKTASPTSVTALPATITYTYVIENKGTATLTPVTLKDYGFDNKEGTADDITPTLVSKSINTDNDLDVGEKWTFTSTYIVTQANLDAAKTLTNYAEAFGDDAPSSKSSADVSMNGSPAVQITKSCTPGTASSLPTTITCTLTVTNTGAVTLTQVTVTDDKNTPDDTSDDAPFPAVIASLAPDAAPKVYTYSYSITQTQIDAGTDLKNTAKVTATAVITTGTTTVTDTDTFTVDVQKNPTLKITKYLAADSPATSATKAGDVLKYNIKVENTGPVTLTKVVVTDDDTKPKTEPYAAVTTFTGNTDGDTNLDVGETWIYSTTHTVTQAEMDAGSSLVNTAYVVTDEIPGPNKDDETVPVIQKKEMTIVKTASPTSVASVGDVITYTVTVENTGTVTLTNVVVTDVFKGTSKVLTGKTGDTGADNILSPKEKWTFTYTYSVVLADLNGGIALVNVVTATSNEAPSVKTQASVNVPLPGTCNSPNLALPQKCSAGNELKGCATCFGLSSCCTSPTALDGYCKNSEAWNCPDGSKYYCNGGGNAGQGNCPATVFCQYKPGCTPKKNNVHCWGTTYCKDAKGPVTCPKDIPAGSFCYGDGASGPDKPGDNFKVCCAVGTPGVPKRRRLFAMP